MTDAQLATKLDVAASLVSRYKGRGMPTHSVVAAREWMRNNVRKRVKSVAPEEGAEVPDYSESRARREAAEADKAEMAVAVMRGELIEKAEVRAEFAKQAGAVRDGLLNIPARLAPVLAAETSLAAVQTLLDTEIRAVLAQFVGEA
jgi:phage terminase Nu1 subunit (DNA packaging protein)